MGLQTGTGAERVDGSYDDAVAVLGNDTISVSHRLRDVRALWADVAGNVSIITETAASTGETVGPPVTAANAVSFILPAGQALPVRVAYLLATGTDATGLKALY